MQAVLVDVIAVISYMGVAECLDGWQAKMLSHSTKITSPGNCQLAITKAQKTQIWEKERGEEKREREWQRMQKKKRNECGVGKSKTSRRRQNESMYLLEKGCVRERDSVCKQIQGSVVLILEVFSSIN